MTGNTELGIVGLGQMGSNLTMQALEKDIRVVSTDLNDHPDLEERGATVLNAGAYDRLADELEPPRVVYLSLPAGSLIDDVLDAMGEAFEEGDVIMDGGNSLVVSQSRLKSSRN